jgi:Na+-driven multidrug efflux pump
VLTHLMLVGLLPGIGFGLAAASLVGQALGCKDAPDAQRWGLHVMRIALVTVACVMLPAVIVPRVFLGLFIHDPATLALAVTPLRVMAVTLPLDACGMVLMHALNGAGDTRRTMAVSIAMQWVLLLPVAYAIGPVLGAGLTAVWGAQVVYRLIQGAIFARMWLGGRWAGIEV